MNIEQDNQLRQRKSQRQLTKSANSQATGDERKAKMAQRNLLDDTDDYVDLREATPSSASSFDIINQNNQLTSQETAKKGQHVSKNGASSDRLEDFDSDDDGIQLNPSTRETKFTRYDRSEVVDLVYGDDHKKKSNLEDDSDDFDDDEDSSCLVSNRKSAQPLLPSRKSPGYHSLELGGPEKGESTLAIVIQVFIPFLIAGFGTVGAGLVLDEVQHWEVFKNISEVFILVPALLGLKGNLEMTLASRLSTHANLGHLETGMDQWRMATGNIALIQCQATVVAFLAAMFAVIMDWLPEGDFDIRHALLLCAASLLTASIATTSAILIPITWPRPLPLPLGDLTTLSLLAYISNKLYYTIDTSLWISGLLIFVFIALIPVWCMIACQNKYSRDVLYTGWSPVISAMAISSIGGCILDVAVSRFSGIAVFQPVINGVGGNLVAVQASRISTYMHKRATLGTIPEADRKLCFSPCSAFMGSHPHSQTARVLLCMVIPGHLIFTYTINIIQAGHTSVTSTFLMVYLSAAMIQVFFLLYSAHVMILWMWRHKIDPDNSAIPYLTALGDFLGTGLLALAFFLLYSIGDKDSDVGD
ncbi:Solute carrier family 41 member 2 [Halotydeus destructor]|nr:Solute carrier family 41 member 2 [Halotydeus destructor]